MGTSASASTGVAVSDAALSGSGTAVSAVAGVSSNLTVGTLTDANSYGTSSDFTGSGSVSIDWGDQTQAAAMLTGNGGGVYQVGGSVSARRIT